MADQKLIFLDIDGTLVGYDTTIPPSAYEALWQAKRNGHRIFLCSGRPRCAIYPWLLERFPFDGIIAAGGAQVVLGDRCISESLFSPEQLGFLLDYFQRENIYFHVSSAQAIYAEPAFREVVIPAMYALGYSRRLVDSAYRGVIIRDDIRSLTHIEKVSFFLSPHPIPKMNDDLQGRYYITDYSVGSLRHETYFGEISVAGVDKAYGMCAVLRELGAEAADTIAFGDSGNDREMLTFAATSVAMGNATDEIKAIADMVTTAVDQDGIYNAFLQLGLL